MMVSAAIATSVPITVATSQSGDGRLPSCTAAGHLLVAVDHRVGQPAGRKAASRGELVADICAKGDYGDDAAPNAAVGVARFLDAAEGPVAGERCPEITPPAEGDAGVRHFVKRFGPRPTCHESGARLPSNITTDSSVSTNSRLSGSKKVSMSAQTRAKSGSATWARYSSIDANHCSVTPS
jgi:hypothetical protein